MRRFLALGSGAAMLAFGLVAGTAHVHEAADHHAELRGLHLDHMHLGDAPVAPGDHEHAPVDGGVARLEGSHVDHHAGDAQYLTVTARRSLEGGLDLRPPMVAARTTIEAPQLVSLLRDDLSVPLRAPPQRQPTGSRAPPV